MDWFLYDNGLRHERVNGPFSSHNLQLHMMGIFFINGLILTLNRDIVVSFNFNIDLQVLYQSSFQ